MQGRACDRLHQMGPEERGLREAGRLCHPPGRSLRGSLFSSSTAVCKANGAETEPSALLSMCFWGTIHGKDTWLCPSSLPSLLLCQALRHPTVRHTAAGHPKPSPCCSWPQHRAAPPQGEKHPDAGPSRDTGGQLAMSWVCSVSTGHRALLVGTGLAPSCVCLTQPLCKHGQQHTQPTDTGA